MVWALELMEDKYRQLRQHMKFNLPGTTKALLENPIDTLDQIIRMVTKWDGTQVTPQMRNAMVRRSDMGSDTRTENRQSDTQDLSRANYWRNPYAGQNLATSKCR